MSKTYLLRLCPKGASTRRCEVVLLDGLRAVRRNKGKARVEGVSIEESTRHLEQNPTALMRDLKQETYPPRPVRRVMIPKGFGRTRPPDIPNVRERVAQEEPFRLRSPLFERLFHDDSYGFRPGCSCHMALERVAGNPQNWLPARA